MHKSFRARLTRWCGPHPIPYKERDFGWRHARQEQAGTTRKFSFRSIWFCNNKFKYCYNNLLSQFENMLQSCHRYCVTKGYCGKLSFATKYKAFVAKFNMPQLSNCYNRSYFLASQILLQKYICYKNMVFVAI